jgi:O-antigen/teichoic acid export membrane protein
MAPEGLTVRVRRHVRVPLFLNAYLLMLSSALQSVLGLPFWALAARFYSPHTVGLSTTIISAASLLTSVGQLGLSSVIVRYLPVAHGASRRFVLTCYAAAATTCLAVSVAALLTVGLWSPPLRFLASDPWWTLLFLLTCVSGVIFQLQDAVMVGLRATRWVPVENALFAISRLALVLVLAHISHRAGIVIAAAAPAILLPIAVNSAIFGRFLPRQLRRDRGRSPAWEPGDLRRLLLGNYVGSLAEMGSLYLLPVIVTDRVGVRAEAYFYIPWSLMLGLTVLAANMASSLSVETSDGERLGAQVRAALKVVLGIVVPAAAVVALLAHPLLLIFGAGYAAHGAGPLRWMMLAAVPTAATMVALAVARVRHDGRLIAASQIAGAVSLVTAAILLLGVTGIAGAGMAAVLSALVSLSLLAPGLWSALPERG